MAVKNTRKPRIQLPERKTPPPPKPQEPVKAIKNMDEVLEACRRMTEKYAGQYECITDLGRLKEYIELSNKNKRMALDTETTGLDIFKDEVVGFSLYTKGLKGCYVPLRHLSRFTGKVDTTQLKVEDVVAVLNSLNEDVLLDYANAQFDLLMMIHSLGVDYTKHKIRDALIAARILNTERKAGTRNLKDLHADYCKTTRGPRFSELFKPGTFNLCPYKLGYTYAARDAEMTWELMDVLDEELNKETPLKNVFYNIEMPLIPVLIGMRERGVLIDQAKRSELSVEYHRKEEEAIRKFETLYAPYIPRIKQYQVSHAGQKGSKIDLPVRIGSNPQLQVLLYDIIGFPDPERNRSVDKVGLIATNSEIGRAILDYREAHKLLSTYIDGLDKFIQPDNTVHSEIVQIGADTGRTSCIAEGTLIECPGISKPIEEIQVGDDVYTYDDDGKLCIRKVTNVFDNGIRECVTLKWQSTGTNEVGELTCTPDHMIKTKHDGWVMADHLKPRQKVYHLRVRDCGYERVLAGTNELYMPEDTWIKYVHLGCTDRKLHIHHVDGNHKNNALNNLVIVDQATHKRIHWEENKDKECYRGVGKFLGKMTPEQHEKYLVTHKKMLEDYFQEHGILYRGLPYTKDQWLEMLEKADWRFTQIPHDLTSVIHNVQVHRIDYFTPYQKRAAEKGFRQRRIQMTPTHINYALSLADGDVEKAAELFGTSVRNLKTACEKYSIAYNHMILSIAKTGPKHVYDLEVEDTHCFIAGEICVHNCKNPNLQNIPSKNREIRQMYMARPGYALVSCDYSGQEPRLTASLCEDAQMIDTYKKGLDLYSMIAAVAFNTTYEECQEHKNGELYLEGKARRGNAKTIVLGICYGRQIPSIAEQLNCTIDEAQNIYNKVTGAFPGLLKAQDEAMDMAHRYGYVTTLWGRRRHLSAMMHDDYEFEYAPGCNPDFDPFNPTADAMSTEVPKAIAQGHLKKLQSIRKWKEKQGYIQRLRDEDGIIVRDYSKVRAETGRKSLNARIQGSAADMTKLAMIHIDNDSRLKELDTHLLMMVHDEVICEVPEKYLKEAVAIIQERMENVAKELPVPFRSDAEVSRIWYGKEINYTDEDEIN